MVGRHVYGLELDLDGNGINPELTQPQDLNYLPRMLPVVRREVIAFVLITARFYIYLRFSKAEKKARPIPEWVVAAYMKFRPSRA